MSRYCDSHCHYSMGLGRARKNSAADALFLPLLITQHLMKKAPKLTLQQKAQILGDSRPSAEPLADMDLRVFLKIARKMYCREYSPAGTLLKRHNACIHCGRESELLP